MLGIDAERHAATLLPHVHADDRRAFRLWLVSLARGRTAPGLDARVRTRDGEYLQVRMMGEALGIANGSASSVRSLLCTWPITSMRGRRRLPIPPCPIAWTRTTSNPSKCLPSYPIGLIRVIRLRAL